MIVRNEAHVIEESLAGAAPLIDTWVIVDTGSSDGTQEVVRRFFAERGIPGELHERPWVDFGSNRSEALALCRGKADYAWVLDADDLVVGRLDLSGLTADACQLRLGREYRFWRTQLFRTTRNFRYVGVLHEYPTCTDGPFTEARVEGDYFIDARRGGARSRDPETFRRDAELLRKELEKNPADDRAAFYLAQSLRDAGDPAGALAAYQRRAAMGGWIEEVFYSLLQVASCRERLGEPFETVLGAYLSAWQARPSRAEALVEAARLCRLTSRWDLAAMFARQAASRPFPVGDRLFVPLGAYEWRALDELSIAAHYTGHMRESFDACMDLLLRRRLPEGERARIEANRDFAVPAVLEETALYPKATIRRLQRRLARPRRRAADVVLTITSCKRFELFERTVNSFLNCCEDIDRIGRFICIDDGSREDERCTMRERYPFFEFVWKPAGERGHARSMNHLREGLSARYWLHLEDDWQFFVRDRYVERAVAILADDPDIGQVLFNRNYAETLADREIAGGEVCTTRRGLRYRRHQYLTRGSGAFDALLATLPRGGRTNAWWPHYSLRPSLLRVAAVREVGAYDPAAEHFELDFARRWSAAGWVSAFFDLVTCVHIGTLTGESGPDRRPNAYDLNEQPQFGLRRRTPAVE
jgi:Glycosyl transferase family 2